MIQENYIFDPLPANPSSGKRDLPILKTLTRAFNQDKPTFAIEMIPCGAGGQIQVGDKVSLLG